MLCEGTAVVGGGLVVGLRLAATACVVPVCNAFTCCRYRQHGAALAVLHDVAARETDVDELLGTLEAETRDMYSRERGEGGGVFTIAVGQPEIPKRSRPRRRLHVHMSHTA